MSIDPLRLIRQLRRGAGLLRRLQRGAPSSGAPSPGRATSTVPSAEPREAHHPDREPGSRAGGARPTGVTGVYPGDYRGRVELLYAPDPDGDPDPGEIVWTWVPYEEDHTRGKDRPVLIVGIDGAYLLVLMLTSKDHSTTAWTEPGYVDIGTGPWDRKGRASEIRVDRIIRARPEDIRREGAVLPRDRFEAVAHAIDGRR